MEGSSKAILRLLGVRLCRQGISGEGAQPYQHRPSLPCKDGYGIIKVNLGITAPKECCLPAKQAFLFCYTLACVGIQA